MKTYFRYILSAFIVAIIYLFYLIVKFHFEQYQVDNFFVTINATNEKISEINAKKTHTEKYIHTNAYISQMAKSMQNKQFPGEEMINIITQADVDGNVDVDSREVISAINKRNEDPTEKLSNPEKWLYIYQNGLIQK